MSRKEDESRFGDVVFGQELRRRREQAGLTLRALGELVDYNYAHVSKVETGAKPATREFVTLCDKALGADGQLLAVWSSGRTRPRIAQLPAAPPVFLGRTEELRALDEIGHASTRESARVVLIEGPAGVGKTALALTWAHRAAGRFPDGQLYADLHGFAPAGRERVDPNQVLEGFLGALGVDEVPATPGRRAALYRSILADQRLLIVLDNVADVTQVEPLLPGTSRCLVVVTSRARLPQLSMQVDLTRLTLDPLDDRQAVRLLAAVVGHRRADLDPGALQELAHACSGLPLALRLAAERIASSPGQPVSEFAADISAGKQAGTAAINDAVVALREIFSWSYRTLDEQAASVFRHLGLKRLHTVHASSVAALAGISRPAARGLLDRLAGLHLVQLRSPGRYTILDHVWGYAAECASDIADPDRTMALQRLATWYLHSAWGVARALAPARYVPDNLRQVPAGIEPETFATPAAAVRWCDAELKNFTSVERLMAGLGMGDAAWQFAVALIDYFRLRRAWTAWEETHAIAREAASAAREWRGESWIWANLAELFRLKRDFPQARLRYAVALALSRRTQDVQGQAWAYLGHSRVAADCRQWDLSAAQASRAERMFASCGNLEGRAQALTAVADAHLARGHPELARAVLQRNLMLFEGHGYRRGCGQILTRFAAIDRALGRNLASLGALNDALAAFTWSEDRWNAAETLVHRGEVLAELGRLLQARRSWRAAISFYQEIGDRRASVVERLLLEKSNDRDGRTGNGRDLATDAAAEACADSSCPA